MTMRKLADISHSEKNIVNYLHVLLFLIIFIGLSILLFYKVNYASEIYLLMSLSVISSLNEAKRNDFLRLCFKKTTYLQIRLLENLIIATPFIIFLLIKKQYYSALFLLVITCLMAMFRFKTKYNITIPTPFFKKPFEFIIGFRATFYIFIIAYVITILAIRWDNFNIGIFALLLIFGTIMGYYLKTEDEFFVWIHSHSPKEFIFEKIKTAFLFTFFLCLPVLIILNIFYLENIGMILLFMGIGYVYLTAVILAKYSVYPNSLDLKQMMLLAICLIIPLLIIVIIPVFAKQAIERLKGYL